MIFALVSQFHIHLLTAFKCLFSVASYCLLRALWKWILRDRSLTALYWKLSIMLSAPLTRHYKADVSAELTTDWHRTRHQDTLAHAATHSLASLMIWCCNHEVMKPFDPDFTFSILPQKQWGDRSINLTQMGVATWAASQYGTCTFIMSWKWVGPGCEHCEQGRELGSHTTLRDEAYEEIIGADRDLTPRYGWQ